MFRWAVEESAWKPVHRGGKHRSGIRVGGGHTCRAETSPVGWLTRGALTLGMGGTALYWWRCTGACLLMWRWGSEVLSRGRNR